MIRHWANVGIYSEIFASLGAHVIAVEPLPENVVVLQKHCAYNERVRIVQAAAGPHMGTGIIRRGQSHAAASMSPEWINFAEAYYRLNAILRPGSTNQVPTTTLDTVSKPTGTPLLSRSTLKDMKKAFWMAYLGNRHVFPSSSIPSCWTWRKGAGEADFRPRFRMQFRPRGAEAVCT